MQFEGTKLRCTGTVRQGQQCRLWYWVLDGVDPKPNGCIRHNTIRGAANATVNPMPR